MMLATRTILRGHAACLLLACSVIFLSLTTARAQQCSVVTLAGRPMAFSGDGGLALDARLFGAGEVAIGPNGRIFVVDSVNRRIRVFTEGGVISTVAGTGAYGDAGDGGAATLATFRSLSNLAVERSGNIYASDSEARRIRKIAANGVISHFAGTGVWRYSGDGGPAANAGFASIRSMAAGPDGSVFVLDDFAHCVRRIGTDGRIARYAGKLFLSSSVPVPGDPIDFTGPALEATFQAPVSIAVDGEGNLFVADSLANLVRKVTPQGAISRIAGNGTFASSADGVPATSASLRPDWLAVDADNTVYVQDVAAAPRIRRILPSGLIQAFATASVVSGAASGGGFTALRTTPLSGSPPEPVTRSGWQALRSPDTAAIIAQP